MLCTAGLVAGGHLKFVLVSAVGADWVTISVNMPQGTTATQTAKVVRHIEQQALVLRDQLDAEREDGASIYRNVFTYIGDQPTAPAFLPFGEARGWSPRASRRSYH